MVYPDDSHQLEANGNLSLVRYILLSEVSIVCLLAYLPKSIVWRLVAFVAVTNLNLGALKSRTGDVFTDYAIGCAIATRLVANSYLVFLADPLDNFQHEKDEVGPREMPFLRRIWWAFCIINGSRGVGWNYAIPKITPRPTEGRKTFILSRLGHSIGYFFLVDLCSTYQYFNPIFSQSGTRNALSIRAQGPLMCIVNASFWALGAVGGICLPYSVASLVGVTTQLTDPRDWPAQFGHWTEAYTVRRLWGRIWHQNMYRFLSAYGKWTARKLDFAQGSRASSLTQLLVAFAISGLIHAAGDFSVHPSFLGVTAPFFICQAIAIMLEDAVIWLALRSNIPISGYLAKMVGYGWVCCWFAFSGPIFVDALLMTGLAKDGAVPRSISPCGRVLELLQGRTGVVLADLFPPVHPS